MKARPVGDLGGATRRIFTLERLGMRLEGPNSGHGQTKPSLQDTRRLSSRRPASSSRLLHQRYAVRNRSMGSGRGYDLNQWLGAQAVPIKVILQCIAIRRR